MCTGILTFIKAFLKVGSATKDTWHRKSHEGPHVHQAVLDRCAREHQAVFAVKVASRLGCLRIRVFNLLTLVEDTGQPLHLREFFSTKAELSVVEHKDINFCLKHF